MLSKKKERTFCYGNNVVVYSGVKYDARMKQGIGLMVYTNYTNVITKIKYVSQTACNKYYVTKQKLCVQSWHMHW